MNQDRQNDRRIPSVTLDNGPKPFERERMTARPAVLRALTDLFCLREDPSEEEVARFRELALMIIPEAGPSTRLYVAAKLARHPMAPRDVLEKLAGNDAKCAALLLEHARNFPLDAQLSAASTGDRAAALALAARPNLEARVGDALVARNDPHVTRALADNPRAAITARAAHAVEDDGRPDRIYAERLKARAPAPTPPEHFLAADSHARAGVIAAARRASLGQPRSPVLRDDALIREMLDHAIERRWEDFVACLSRKTGLRAQTVADLARDPGGEPLALLLALVGATPQEAIRIFLCCDAPIAHSYLRVRDLSLVTADTPPTVAGALVFAMTGSRPRISTYSGGAERAAHVASEGPRAMAPAPMEAAAPGKTQVVLRRQIR